MVFIDTNVWVYLSPINEEVTPNVGLTSADYNISYQVERNSDGLLVNVEDYTDSWTITAADGSVVVTNAQRFKMPKGGVTVTLTDDAKVIVKDTGIGIAPDDVPRVFEKGFTGANGRMNTGDGSNGGRATGLGLYLCNKVAHKLNIGLSVESEVGKGTAFTVDMQKEEITVE